MGQQVVWVEFREPLGDCDSLIIALQILQRARQPVHGFRECRVGGQGLSVSGYCFFEMSLRHQIERSVVAVFGCLAGFFGHGVISGGSLDSSMCIFSSDISNDSWVALHILTLSFRAKRGIRCLPGNSPPSARMTTS